MYNKSDLNKGENYNILPFLMEGDFYFSIGVKAFQKRDFNKAIKWFKKAIELVPTNPLYQCQLSVLYTEIRSYHKANQVLTRVLSDFGDDYVDCYYLIANNYAHLGLFHDAQKNVEMYLKMAPNGDFTEEAKQLLEMLELYNETEIEEDYEDEWLFDEEDELLIYQETAFHHLENEEWDQALPVLEEMMTLYPDYIVAKHDYALALFFSGDREEAMEMEAEWYSSNPNSIHSLVNLAVFNHESGNLEAAMGYIETLQNVYPMHEQQRLKIAIVLAQTGHYEEAVERFSYLSKKNMKQHISYFRWFSLALYYTDSKKKALNIWEEGCKRHPFLQRIGGIENAHLFK